MIQDAYEVLRDKLKLTIIPEKDQIARFIKLLFEKLKINPEKSLRPVKKHDRHD